MGILHVCIPAPTFTTPMSPKEIHFTDFRRFSSGQHLSFIQHTVLTVMVECGKWKWSLQHYISLLKFKFTHGTLITNFEIHNFSFMSVEYDKCFMITSCINIFNLDYKFLLSRNKFCKNDHIMHTSDSYVPKRVPSIWPCIHSLFYQEIILPGAEILSLAEMWILPSPIGRILLFKIQTNWLNQTVRGTPLIWVHSATSSLQ